MKIGVLYGFGLALASFLLSVLCFDFGFYATAESLSRHQGINSAGFFILIVAALVLGIRARRNSVPASDDFGYGRAFGTGLTIVVAASVLGAALTYLFVKVIDPQYGSLVVQGQLDKMQARGLDPEQIDRIEALLRRVVRPRFQAVAAFFSTLILGTLVALVVGAALKRPARAAPPAPPV